MSELRIHSELPGEPRERRPQTARARATNNPLAPPASLRGQSPLTRRWRDLARAYAAQLGAERLRREDVVARLRALIWITVELERLHDQQVGDRPPVATLLHLAQEQRVLIAELGLNAAAPADGAPNLRKYLDRRKRIVE